MALKLRVISDHYKALGKRSSRLFGVTGGKIGRAGDNDWILPDPDRYVSSHHCKVDFRAGQWVLEDTSTNGVFINGSDTPASVEGAYTLQDGDRLRPTAVRRSERAAACSASAVGAYHQTIRSASARSAETS